MHVNKASPVQEVEPEEVREEVLDLLWEHGHWPGSSREDYAGLWAWRYGRLGDGRPRVWVVREDGGAVVAHYAIFPRRFRMDGTTLRGAVAGDLLVHRKRRRSPLGILLSRIPLRLTRDGELDVVVVTATPAAHTLAVGIGYRDLGHFERHVDMRTARGLLGRRLPLALPLAPALDLGLGVRRRIRQRGLAEVAGRLTVTAVEPDAVAALGTDAWRPPPERLVSAGSPGYLVGRFLGDPFHRRTLYGLFDRHGGAARGYVVVDVSGPTATVQDCRVDAATLDDAAAIALVGRHLPADVQQYCAPTLPGSTLGRELRALGFVRRTPPRAEHPRVLVAALWADAHPLAEALADGERWNLYSGVADA